MSKKCKIEECSAGCIAEDIAYCFHHQSIGFLTETQLLGKKCCKNYIRGCRSQLDDTYNKSACSDCLERERKKDKARRNACKKAQEEAMQKVAAAGGAEVIAELLCCTCCIMRPIEMYRGEKGVQTKTCQVCRNGDKRNHPKRDHEKRLEQGRVYENNPKRQYDSLVRNAGYRNITNELSMDDYLNIAKNNCFYCEELHERGFNGIDRQDSLQGYNKQNCVSCCKMCNYMKNDHSLDTFHKKIEHILTYNGIINGVLYPEVFTNYHNVNYSGYKGRALNVKKFEFEFNNKNEFIAFTNNPCYICGKLPSNVEPIHKNGIDRYDSSIGYSLLNIRPCCCDCNQMKLDFTYDDFMNKLHKIHTHTHSKAV